MRRAYSQDLRERVMAAVDSGTGAYAVASIFRVSVSYIYKLLGRRRRTGETNARPWAGGPKPKLAAYDEALRARVASKPDATLGPIASVARGRTRPQGQHWLPLEKPAATRFDAQKSHCAPLSKTAQISPRLATNGVQASPL